MADAQSEFADLMARVRSGSNDAARELFERYSPHVRRVVRRQLFQKLRRLYDSNDLQQAVWLSFFTGSPQNKNCATPDELIGFLAAITTNKMTDVIRQRLGTLRNDLNREINVDSMHDHGFEELRAVDPTPSQVVMAEERFNRLLLGQSEKCRDVLILLRDGCTQREAAERTGVHPKIVQRLLRKLREQPESP